MSEGDDRGRILEFVIICDDLKGTGDLRVSTSMDEALGKRIAKIMIDLGMLYDGFSTCGGEMHYDARVSLKELVDPEGSAVALAGALLGALGMKEFPSEFKLDFPEEYEVHVSSEAIPGKREWISKGSWERRIMATFMARAAMVS